MHGPAVPDVANAVRRDAESPTCGEPFRPSAVRSTSPPPGASASVGARSSDRRMESTARIGPLLPPLAGASSGTEPMTHVSENSQIGARQHAGPHGCKEFGGGLTDQIRSVDTRTRRSSAGFSPFRPKARKRYTNVPGLFTSMGSAPSASALRPITDNREACGTSGLPGGFPSRRHCRSGDGAALAPTLRRSSEAASPATPGKADIGGGHETPGLVETVGSAGARADRAAGYRTSGLSLTRIADQAIGRKAKLVPRLRQLC